MLKHTHRTPGSPLLPHLLLPQGVVLHTNVWSPLEKLWGTAENSIVFQRDPDADPALGPAIIHGELVMTNSSYIYFRNILFRPAGAGTNAIRASSR